MKLNFYPRKAWCELCTQGNKCPRTLFCVREVSASFQRTARGGSPSTRTHTHAQLTDTRPPHHRRTQMLADDFVFAKQSLPNKRTRSCSSCSLHFRATFEVWELAASNWAHCSLAFLPVSSTNCVEFHEQVPLVKLGGNNSLKNDPAT